MKLHKIELMVANAGSRVCSRIEHLLQIDPAAKSHTYLSVHSSVSLGSLNYWLELLFSAGIATFGLVLNSPAVVIGAMLISPLMTPIIGAGLALAAADLYLGIKSLLSLLLSVIAAIVFSGVLVWLLPFHSPTAEILARTRPNLLDLGVALLSGLAGSMVVARGGGGGGVTALPGVAIAVALMPPLCTVGFGVGSGFGWGIITGAGLLFLTNLAAIVASAFLVFSLVRVDSSEARLEVGAFERNAPELLSRLLQRTRLSKSLGDIGKLHWRALMLILVLAALYVPLRKGLTQVRDETIARSAVRESVRKLVPADAILSQQTDVADDRVRVRLVVATRLDPAKVKQAERDLIRRTGKEVTLSIRKVAGDEELAMLRERLWTPQPPPPAPMDLDSIRAEIVQRIDGPVRQLWPAKSAQMQAYEAGFTGTDIVVRIRYESAEPLNPSTTEALTNGLRAQLGVPALRVVLEQQAPPRPAKPLGKRAVRR